MIDHLFAMEAPYWLKGNYVGRILADCAIKRGLSGS